MINVNANNSFYRLAFFSNAIVVVFGFLGLLLTINQMFNLRILGFQPVGNAYLYYIIGVFLFISFIAFPSKDKKIIRFSIDFSLAVVCLVCSFYLASNGMKIIEEGWDYQAPALATLSSYILIVLILEAVRRCAGLALMIVAVVFGSYPLFADLMPGFLWGTSYDISEAVRAHIMGSDSVVGTPMQVVSQIVIGFILFGVTLKVTGGADFFMDFSMALMGRTRGGPTKVAVVSSAFMGSLSGSVISNIITTGSITIPAMKRAGYPAHYSAAVEACASTGGTLMPPVMGAVAFIMASFVGVPYVDVVVAALLPAILFYIVLLFQVDIYAAKEGIEGEHESQIPRLSETLKDGWIYLAGLALLMYMLIVMRMEIFAPYYASAFLICCSAIFKWKSFRFSDLIIVIKDFSLSISNLVSILAGIGLIIGGLSYSGVAGSFARELLLYTDGNVFLMLIAGAITSFILGMGMTVTACYIFLSVLLAPALVEAGLNPLASHLFILYWGMLSYLTPPVALASITAAGVAGANSTKVSLQAMKMGSALFILPFFFVLNPALVLQGSFFDVIWPAISSVIAMWILASALEGYLYGVGRISLLTRGLLFVAAIATVLPSVSADFVGGAVIALIYVINKIWGKNSESVAVS